MRTEPTRRTGKLRPTIAAIAITAPMIPTAYPAARPGRRPRRLMSHEREVAPRAAPRTTAAAGVPARLADPPRSLATMVATVTAAICPVLPRATPPTRVQTVRRRRRSISLGDVVTKRRLTGRGY